MKRREFDKLIQWKKEVFDPKVEEAKQSFLESHENDIRNSQNLIRTETILPTMMETLHKHGHVHSH